MRTRLTGAAVALIASACIHIPPRPIEPAVTAKALESRSLDDPQMQEFVAAHANTTLPITRWDVETLTLAAFYFHPDLDIARADAAVAHAAIVTAGERPNPTITLPIEHKSEAHPWITVLGFDMPIETANKRGLRVRQATDTARAADLAIAQQAWQIRSAIRTQLAALVAAQASSAILERQHAAQQDLVEALQKRVEFGEGSRVELSQARINARQTELLIHDRASLAAQARARLATAVGVPHMDSVILSGEASRPAQPVATAELRERALVARPDILVSLADYAASESALRLELARQYPDLHIGPGFGWDQGARRWDLGFSSVLPIVSRNRGAIGEAVARRAASEARFIGLQARVIGAVDEARVRYDAAVSKLDATNAILKMQQQQLDSVQRQFNAGAADRVALRTAELELESANLAQAEAAAQVQEAIGALEDALEQPLGGALPQPPVTNPRAAK